MRISATAKRAAVGLMMITAAACQQGSVAPSVSATTSPSPKAPALAACPAASAPPGPQVLLQKQPGPDDLAFDNNGRLLFSDIKTGAVSVLNVDGSVERIAGGMSAPEGIVAQADGRILVGEQGRNRVVVIDPQSHAVTLWHAFPNRTGRDGLDGIGPIVYPSKDPAAAQVIVPDSPNGVVWRVTADGKTATQIGSGMVRPVGAAFDAATGRIFVADEGGTLWVVLGSVQRRFAPLPTPDDVVVSRAGHIFVNTLGDNAIHELDNLGHPVAVISGIQQPQGIALDNADNLYYTEFNTGRIDRVIRTFTLDTPTVTRTTRGSYIICPVIRRAAGFSQPLGLTTGSSLTTSILQLVQPGTVSSGALEVQTTERSITIGVDTTDGSVPLGLQQTVVLSQ